MQLYRFLPPACDRMGILWSLLSIEGSVSLEYSPAGTTHYSKSNLSDIIGENGERLFTTHIDEGDVIMGDVSRLERAIMELDKDFSPEVIFVLGSSVSGVIGTDIKGVCHYVQDRVQAKLIIFDQSGFKGDYSAGLCHVYTALVKELAGGEKGALPKTFNILGASAENFRIHDDMAELERMMQEAFGYTLHTSLCTQTSVAQIHNMAGAEINLVLSYEALEAAKYLQEQFGTPYVYGIPYGYTQSLAWLKNISSILQTPINLNMEDTLSERLEDTEVEGRYIRASLQHAKQEAKVVILGNYDKTWALSTFLQELHLPCVDALSTHSLKGVFDCHENIRTFPDEKEKITYMQELEHCLVFGGELGHMLLNHSNIFVCFSRPLFTRKEIAKHMPFVGIRGADYIRELVWGYVHSLR